MDLFFKPHESRKLYGKKWEIPEVTKYKHETPPPIERRPILRFANTNTVPYFDASSFQEFEPTPETSFEATTSTCQRLRTVPTISEIATLDQESLMKVEQEQILYNDPTLEIDVQKVEDDDYQTDNVNISEVGTQECPETQVNPDERLPPAENVSVVHFTCTIRLFYSVLPTLTQLVSVESKIIQPFQNF